MRDGGSHSKATRYIAVWVTCFLLGTQLLSNGLLDDGSLTDHESGAPGSHVTAASATPDHGGDSAAWTATDHLPHWWLNLLAEDAEEELEACSALCSEHPASHAVTTDVVMRDVSTSDATNRRWPKAACGERGPPVTTA